MQKNLLILTPRERFVFLRRVFLKACELENGFFILIFLELPKAKAEENNRALRHLPQMLRSLPFLQHNKTEIESLR